MTTVVPQPREAAIAAFTRHGWREAYDRFSEADTASALRPADLLDFADAAWWAAEPDMALRVRERAYASYVDAGDRRNAVKVALLLMS